MPEKKNMCLEYQTRRSPINTHTGMPKPTPDNYHTCEAILKKPRKNTETGEIRKTCGYRALPNSRFCGKHKSLEAGPSKAPKQYNPNIIIKNLEKLAVANLNANVFPNLKAPNVNASEKNKIKNLVRNVERMHCGTACPHGSKRLKCMTCGKNVRAAVRKSLITKARVVHNQELRNIQQATAARNFKINQLHAREKARNHLRNPRSTTTTGRKAAAKPKPTQKKRKVKVKVNNNNLLGNLGLNYLNINKLIENEMTGIPSPKSPKVSPKSSPKNRKRPLHIKRLKEYAGLNFFHENEQRKPTGNAPFSKFPGTRKTKNVASTKPKRSNSNNEYYYSNNSTYSIE